MMIVNASDGVISDILILKPRIHRESKNQTSSISVGYIILVMSSQSLSNR